MKWFANNGILGGNRKGLDLIKIKSLSLRLFYQLNKD